MKNIFKNKVFKRFAWLILPMILGIYQSKLNSIQNIIKYRNNNTDELLNNITSDITMLKVFGYAIFFISMLIYFKSTFYKESNRS